jgi:hypothetical protein
MNSARRNFEKSNREIIDGDLEIRKVSPGDNPVLLITYSWQHL